MLLEELNSYLTNTFHAHKEQRAEDPSTVVIAQSFEQKKAIPIQCVCAMTNYPAFRLSVKCLCFEVLGFQIYKVLSHVTMLKRG